MLSPRLSLWSSLCPLAQTLQENLLQRGSLLQRTPEMLSVVQTRAAAFSKCWTLLANAHFGLIQVLCQVFLFPFLAVWCKIPVAAFQQGTGELGCVRGQGQLGLCWCLQPPLQPSSPQPLPVQLQGKSLQFAGVVWKSQQIFLWDQQQGVFPPAAWNLLWCRLGRTERGRRSSCWQSKELRFQSDLEQNLKKKIGSLEHYPFQRLNCNLNY